MSVVFDHIGSNVAFSVYQEDWLEHEEELRKQKREKNKPKDDFLKQLNDEINSGQITVLL